MMFREARQNRTFEDVISQIQESILQGKLKAGDKLPSERNLKEMFKVSRGTLRESLRALEQKRLIHIKTGVAGGAFVCEANTDQISESLDLLIRYRKITLRELAEFREIFEPLVAFRAAEKIKEKDIKELRDIVRSIKKHLDSGELRWNEIMAEDKKFHVSLARLSGNRIFESVLDSFHNSINRYFQRLLPRERWVLEVIYNNLNKIVRAMEKRDSKKVQALVLEHAKEAVEEFGLKQVTGLELHDVSEERI